MIIRDPERPIQALPWVVPDPPRRASGIEAGRSSISGSSYYVIFDPEGWLGDRPLRAFVRHGPSYVDLLDCSWMESLGVGLTLWEGSFEGWHSTWLRWCDREGNLLLTGEEQAEVERARADRLLARLRELGLDE